MAINSSFRCEIVGSKTTRVNLTCQQQLAKLLAGKFGATNAQMQKAFGRQPHTISAAISALRKAGFQVLRANTEKGGVYHIAGKA